MTTAFAPGPTGLKYLLSRCGLRALLHATGLAPAARALLRWLSPSQRQLYRELAAFRRSFGSFLARGQERADPARRVLVVSIADWPTQVKLDAILAKALQLHGLTPVIATYRHCTLAQEYHRTFGLDTFAFLDDSLSPQANRAGSDDAREFLRQPLTFRKVLDLEYRDVQVGRHVLSSIVANLRRGSTDFSDPRVAAMLQRMLPAAMQLVWGAEALFDRVRPEFVLLMEHGYAPYGEIFDVALNRDIPVVQYMHGFRSDALLFKKYRKESRNLHPFALSHESWEHVRRMAWTPAMDEAVLSDLRDRYESGTMRGQKLYIKFCQPGKTMKSAEEVRRQLGLEPAKKTAVVYSHVLWDATFFYGTTLFDDYEHWLIETVKAACRNCQLNWVIKIHPDYVWKMKIVRDHGPPPDVAALNQVGPLPEHVKVLEPGTDISTFSLFEVTDYCVTVRGTVGTEMSCLGVPVLTAGTGRYDGLGFTIDSACRAEYLDKLSRLHTFARLTAEQVQLARKYAYAFFRLRSCPFTTFEMLRSGLEQLNRGSVNDVVLRAQSFGELCAAADLRRFADWVLGAGQPADFLMPFSIDATGEHAPSAIETP